MVFKKGSYILRLQSMTKTRKVNLRTQSEILFIVYKISNFHVIDLGPVVAFYGWFLIMYNIYRILSLPFFSKERKW